MRSIFIGMAGGGAAACEKATTEAVRKAYRPARLTFGLCPGEDMDAQALFKALKPAAVQILPGAGLTPREASRTVYSLYGGQDVALQVMPDMIFGQDWDRLALEELRLAEGDMPLLSCVPSSDGIPRALAAQGFDVAGRLRLTAGTPVIHAARPPRAGFLHPGFILGGGEWMCTALEEDWEGDDPLALSLRAYDAGFQIGTVSRRLGRWTASAAPAAAEKPEGDLLKILARFEKDRGLSFEKRQVSGACYLGIFDNDLRYHAQLSMGEGLRHLLRRRREAPIRVMLATAMEEYPADIPMDAFLATYENLAELKRLSLCCYCPREHLARLRRFLPNTYYARPGQAPEGTFLRNKPLFMAQAMHQFPAQTHYGWIDMDYLTHPLYPSAVFHWGKLTDDKIHLAVVDGVPDTSLIVAPREKIEWLLDVVTVLEPAPEWGPGDTGLFKCLIDTYPGEFALHPMEGRRRLLSLCQPLL